MKLSKRSRLALLLLPVLFSLTIYAVTAARSSKSVPAKPDHAMKSFAQATPLTSISETNAPVAQATPVITQSALTGGGGNLSGENLSLTGAIGQGVAGTINGGNLSLGGGFLGVAVGAVQCPTITISPATLVSGRVGQPYSQQLTQTGSTSAITWSLVGTVPNGFTLNATTGLISFTPTTTDTVNFTVTATDTNGCKNSRTYSIAVVRDCPLITVAPTTLPDATQGVAYNQKITASGGQAPYTITLIAGALPPGLMLNQQDGTLSGMPTTAGRYDFAVRARDANNCDSPREWTFNVLAAPTVARTVRVGESFGNPGGIVVVPIELVSQGDENAAGFSLTFDPAVLSNPSVVLGADAAGASFQFNLNQAAAGRLGLLLALPSDRSFAAGTRRILNITFTISSTTAANSTPIGFGNQPMGQEVTNASAAPLSTRFVGGTVQITRGIEADVAPHPDGNGVLSTGDYVQIGRFVAKLDTAANGGEFQRADSAPINSFGDGQITMADMVQAGRYVTGLDQTVQAGGPMSPSTPQPFAANQTLLRLPATRPKRQTTIRIAQFGEDAIAIDLEGYGTENAVSFSLSFNSKAWRLANVEAGNAASGAWLAVNDHDSVNGNLGLAFALPTGQRFGAGINRVAIVRFKSINDSVESVGLIGFADYPVPREVVNDKAEVVPSAFAIATQAINARAVTVLSEAGLRGELRKELLTAESRVISFGEGFTTTAAVANGDFAATELAGVRVWVKDSFGVERPAAILSVSPDRIAYQIPAGTAEGFAIVRIISSDGTVSVGAVQIAHLISMLFRNEEHGKFGVEAFSWPANVRSLFCARGTFSAPELLCRDCTGQAG